MAISAVPYQTPLVEVPSRTGQALSLRIQTYWVRWLTGLIEAVNVAAQQIGSVSLTAQSASLGATAIPAPALTTRRYRVSTYARITRAATTSSTLTVTIGWTDGGVACSWSGAAITGNTTATTQSGDLVVKADTGTTITYATTYGSVGATTMQYALAVTLEAMP